MAEAIIRIDKVDEGYLVKVFVNGKFFDSKLLSKRELKEYELGNSERVRRPEIIKEELRHLEEVVKVHRRLLKKYPNDKAIEASLEQFLFPKKELAEELRASISKKEV